MNRLIVMTLAGATMALGLGACDGNSTAETGDRQGSSPATGPAEAPRPSSAQNPGPADPAGQATGSTALADSSAGQPIDTRVVDGQGNEIGTLQVHPLADGVRLDLHVEGLQPGPHAVHLHTSGVCQGPSFESAGGHYNPADSQHGMADGDTDMADTDHHAGDMLNQTVNDNGELDVQLTNHTVTIDGPDNALLDKDGTALVIHAGADDYQSQPAGDAGDRVACAMITATG